MPKLINTTGDAALQLATALAEGTEESQASALRDFAESIAETVRADYAELSASHDVAVLAQRGIRQLTGAEKKFYEGLTQAMRSESPQQAFADFLTADSAGDDFMPETILEDVFKNLEREHQLLQEIDFHYTGYMTKWLRNKHRVAKAVWGAITGTITQEITSEFEWMRIDQNKLTAYAVIPLDILDMGYSWVDAYVRRALMEAIYEGLEDGIVNGKGVANEPVGLIRDIHRGVTIHSTNGYPAKSATSLSNFGPDYLAKLASLAKTESWTEGEGDSAKTYGGRGRKLPYVVFIANTTTMLGKVKPALLCVGPNGYAYGQPAIPTKFIECEYVADNKAIVMAPKGYTFCVGGKRNGQIVFDDSFKFLEDARTFKAIQHGDGIAEDDTAVKYLNVANIEACKLPVVVEGAITGTNTTTVSGTIETTEATPTA